ncbi:MAG TPA: host-nuclease inhibitor Gam family protein [Candidatus Paceibacterota bacterium]|nr:host-nuclease inhibitor Gam family protein [Candidatus Paceibacterota bacterium]
MAKKKKRAVQKPFAAPTIRALPDAETLVEAKGYLAKAAALMRDIEDIERAAETAAAPLRKALTAIERATERKVGRRLATATELAERVERFAKQTNLPKPLKAAGGKTRERDFPPSATVDEQTYYAQVAELGEEAEKLFVNITKSPNKDALRKKENRELVEKLASVSIGNDRAFEIIPTGTKHFLQKIVTAEKPQWQRVPRPKPRAKQKK